MERKRELSPLLFALLGAFFFLSGLVIFAPRNYTLAPEPTDVHIIDGGPMNGNGSQGRYRGRRGFDIKATGENMEIPKMGL